VRRPRSRSSSKIWAAIEKLRTPDSDVPVSPQDLKIPEWRLFSRPDPAKNNRDLQVRVVDPPAAYRRWIEKIVLIDKLREVRALGQ
jgi:hypothetical protein